MCLNPEQPQAKLGQLEILQGKTQSLTYQVNGT